MAFSSVALQSRIRTVATGDSLQFSLNEVADAFVTAKDACTFMTYVPLKPVTLSGLGPNPGGLLGPNTRRTIQAGRQWAVELGSDRSNRNVCCPSCITTSAGAGGM